MILSTVPGSSLPSLAVIGAGLAPIEGRRVAALSTIVRMIQAGRSPMHVARYVYSLDVCLGSDVIRAMQPSALPGTFGAAVLDILTDVPWYA